MFSASLYRYRYRMSVWKVFFQKNVAAVFALVLLCSSWSVQAQDDMLIIEDDEDVLVIDDSDEVLLIEDDSDSNVQEGGNWQAPDMSSEAIEADDERTSDLSSVEMYENQSTTFPKQVEFSLDQVRLEWASFPDSNASDDQQAYGHISASLEWNFSQRWSVRLAARYDAYHGWNNGNGADRDWNDDHWDYGETYLRYKGKRQTITFGTQQIVWGRIDEVPPTDRLSTQDLRRFVIDDLDQRRLASPVIRYQHFFENSQLDLVAYPDFREAELPHEESSWYPVNRTTGEVLGIETNAAIEFLVRNTPLHDDPPDSDGGVGIRYSGLGDTFDYAFTVQSGRQSVPYFAFNPVTNRIESRYPRTDIVGTDFSFEGLGGTVKVEMAWLSDVSVTRINGLFDTVEALSWGLALEMFPGDGDARLNVQLTGQQLLDSPAVLDRDRIVSINGSYEVPFADNNWRGKVRFNAGLDARDIYLNPELAYIGWDDHEAYVELHYFDGDKGTPGGFYEDNSVATLGWRANY